jgi:RNA polymerase sigma-70 factor, ECF subfamily
MVVRSGAGMSGENAFLSGLLKASAGQDQHAFAELYRLTAPRINAVVHRLPGANVGDAVQETYIRIWHNAGSYDPDRGGAIPWMIAIARNIAIDRLRAQTARIVLPLEAIEEMAATVQDDDGQDLDVRRCLGALEPQYARLLALAFYSGYSHSEIASRLDMPLGTVKSSIKRGLSRLKDCLDAREQ